MESTRHPYRKFVFGSVTRSGDGLHYTLTGARYGRPIRLDPAELELARLFDGSRDAAALRRAAAELLHVEIDAAGLERFANELASSDLLAPGTLEPLPVPAQTEAEAANLGWNHDARPEGTATDAIAPSNLPGSLSGPGLPGSLTGLWGAFRGQVAPPRVRLDVSSLLPLGALLNLPLMMGGIGLAVLAALVIGATVLMSGYRVEMGLDFLRLLSPASFALALVGSAYFVNLLSELARAAAIQRLTRAKPVFGLMFGVALIPRFHCDTGGAAETATRGERLRIVTSTLVAQLLLVVFGVLLWLVFRNGHSLLPSLATMLVLMASVFFFLQVNPLVKRDGYNALVQWFQASDLREQSLYAIFGYERPWNESRRLSRRVLQVYGLLCAAYTLWVTVWIAAFPGRWLKGTFGTAGIVLVLVALAYSIYRSARRNSARRGAIGAKRLDVAAPNRGDWVLICVLAAILLFPYRYEPSGDFVVLPHARAEVRALTPGDVREVMVKEGDMVKAGQVIARVADDLERAAVASGEASIAKLQSDLAIATRGGKSEEIAEAEQQVAVAEKKLEYSRREADRLATAFTRKAISDQEYQRAKALADVDQQQLFEAKKHLIVVSAPARNERIDGIQADIARERAQLESHLKFLEETQIKAPIAGRVVSGTLRYAVGDYLERGRSLAKIEDASQLLVQIRVSENDVGELKVGDKAYAKAWAFPDSVYPGTVREIAPSAEKSDYGKVVRVIMAIDQPDGRLLPEMTGYAKVSAEKYPLVVAFTRPLVRFFLVEVWSWLP